MHRVKIDRAKSSFVLRFSCRRRRQAHPPNARALGRRILGVLGAVMVVVAPAHVEAQKMYWVDQRRIHRANLDGSHVEQVLPVTKYTMGIALDLPAGKVYWADWLAFRIMRASLDGSNVEIVADTEPKRPRGVALHRATGKLYWTAGETGVGGGVFRANLDGPRRTEIIILTELDYVTGIALDPEGPKIYWTETEPTPGLSRIRRANLDGSSAEDLITGETYAGAIALDLSDGKLYWTDGRTQPPRIRRADLDGSHIETVLVERDIPLWIALDSEAGKMYWTVRGLSATVRRANLDGSDVENLVIRGRTLPYGIALDTICLTGGPDCQGNGVPDTCDIMRAISRDCDGTGIPDECEIADCSSSDCNANGIPDTCEPDEDCNANGRQDICDLADETSLDCNDNGVPDDCEPDEDCNHNRVQDICDIATGSSTDCDDNETPDECQADCNRNGVADNCELECNGNGIPDECDVAHRTSPDCNGNLIPDECDLDCNDNGVPDDCDIAKGGSLDDDGSGIPDECEVFSGCLSGPDYFDYAPHRESPEAEQLAMNLTGQLRAPDDVYNRILRDLRLVRLTFPETATVIGWGDYAPNHLFVRLDLDMPQAGYEALNRFYQVIADHEYIGNGVHLLTFCDNINVRVLAQEYETLAEVRYAEPDSVIGDGDEVTVTPLGTVYRYMIRYGYGDCMSGCICSIIWVVDVDERGTVVLVSYDEFGGCAWCGLCDDCNNNGIDDPCDIACGSPLGECDLYRCGQSVDCNRDGIPDECGLRGDFDEDGLVTASDHASFLDTFLGPGIAIGCSMADLHRNGQVDLHDYAEFQLVFEE